MEWEWEWNGFGSGWHIHGVCEREVWSGLGLGLVLIPFVCAYGARSCGGLGLAFPMIDGLESIANLLVLSYLVLLLLLLLAGDILVGGRA